MWPLSMLQQLYGSQFAFVGFADMPCVVHHGVSRRPASSVLKRPSVQSAHHAMAEVGEWPYVLVKRDTPLVGLKGGGSMFIS